MPDAFTAAILFDVDGTIAETERDGHRVAFNRAFAELGLDWHWDPALYGALLQVTGGKERISHFARTFRPEVAQGPDFDRLVVELHRIKTDYYTRGVSSAPMPLRPGVARLIGEARAAGVRLAIATTTTMENVDALLRASLAPDAPEWFEAIGAGDVVPAKKPAPDIYRWVLARLGLAADRCVAIEDSAAGLTASRSAGVPTLIAVSEYTKVQTFHDASLMLSDLGEPGAPFRVLKGDACGFDWVSLESLEAWRAGGQL
jgi:beta-phosphoglucomutase-like phosphatase (HAD superfamily)